MTDDLLRRTGENIRATRERQGLSQAALGKLLGCTQTAVSYWEDGRRAIAIDDLARVAQALDVDLAELLPGATPRPEQQFTLPLRTGRKHPRQTIYDANDVMVASGMTSQSARWLVVIANAGIPEDLPPIEQDPVALALGIVDLPEDASDELRASVERLRRRVADRAGAEVKRLRALTATCTCPDSCETYAGPEADCPVHGAVRALNEAMAAIDRFRDRASTLTAWAHAELAEQPKALHYVLSVIVNLGDALALPAALDQEENHG